MESHRLGQLFMFVAFFVINALFYIYFIKADSIPIRLPVCPPNSNIPWPWCVHFTEFFKPKHHKTPSPFKNTPQDNINMYKYALYNRNNYRDALWDVKYKGKNLESNDKAFEQTSPYANVKNFVPSDTERVVPISNVKDEKMLNQAHDQLPTILQKDATEENTFDALD